MPQQARAIMADRAHVRTGKVDHIGTGRIPVSRIGILQPCALHKDRLWEVKLSRVASDGTSQCFWSANPATGRCDGLPNPWPGRHVREWCMPSNRRYRNPAQLRFSGGVSPNKCQKRRRHALVHIFLRFLASIVESRNHRAYALESPD